MDDLPAYVVKGHIAALTDETRAAKELCAFDTLDPYLRTGGAFHSGFGALAAGEVVNCLQHVYFARVDHLRRTEFPRQL